MCKENLPEGNEEQGKKQKKRPWWLVALLLLLISLTLLTSAIVVIRIGGFLPENVNVIFIVPKKPEFNIGSREDAWNTRNELDFFKVCYTDREGNLTVHSDDGDEIIAPGTSNEYTFTLSNTGNMAVDYDTTLGIKISAGEFDTLPVKMKMQRHDGTYVFGSDASWINVEDIRDIKVSGTIGSGRYTTYTLIWKWDYDGGDDEFDTMLGNAALDSDISLSLTLDTFAEASADSASGGGERIIDKNTGKPFEAYGGQIGGDFRMPYFPILLFTLILVINAFAVLFIKNRLKNKKKPGDGESK